MRQAYELPRTQYAFLVEVKEKLGWLTHSVVSNAVCDGSYRLDSTLLRIRGEEQILRDIAAKYDIKISVF